MAIYLDNAATSFPKPPGVYAAVDHALREIGVGPGRGGYRQSLDATRLVFAARESAAALFGIADSSRVVFTHSATEGLNLATIGLLRPGDHLVTTTTEHNSLARPLNLLARRGVEVTRVSCDRQGFVDPNDISAAIRSNTRLIALSHCSNVTGAIQPVFEIGGVARQHSVLFLLDAAQSAGSIPLDVRELNVDLLAAPGHKGLFGPQGTGLLYVADGVELEPLMVGGTGGYSSSDEQPEAMPERFESGTLNTPGIAGLKAGIEFVMEQGVDAIRRKESQLVARLLAGVADIPTLTVYGPDDPARRGSVVSFAVAGHDPSEIAYALDRDWEISVRAGLHCAPDAHRSLGTYPAGMVRVSPGYFNVEADIDTFVKALRAIVAP